MGRWPVGSQQQRRQGSVHEAVQQCKTDWGGRVAHLSLLHASRGIWWLAKRMGDAGGQQQHQDAAHGPQKLEAGQRGFCVGCMAVQGPQGVSSGAWWPRERSVQAGLQKLIQRAR